LNAVLLGAIEVERVYIFMEFQKDFIMEGGRLNIAKEESPFLKNAHSRNISEIQWRDVVPDYSSLYSLRSCHYLCECAWKWSICYGNGGSDIEQKKFLESVFKVRVREF
jgi:hypothetical protein